VSDEELLHEIVRGDQAAFAELYDRYADRVYGLVRRIVGEPSRSEQIAIEAFVDAWRTARSYDPGRDTVATWLLTHAHQRAINPGSGIRG
jgi:RNA polymerase sigma-70 factor, ECF subfamily